MNGKQKTAILQSLEHFYKYDQWWEQSHEDGRVTVEYDEDYECFVMIAEHDAYELYHNESIETVEEFNYALDDAYESIETQMAIEADEWNNDE